MKQSATQAPLLHTWPAPQLVPLGSLDQVVVEVAGVQMKKGDWISIFDTLGSTDPAAFKDPLSVDLNRRNISHFGFSTGPHLCMGIHLARRELETALREWLARIPMWRLKPGVEMKTHGGHTFGFDNLDLEWDV